ncbi:transposase [Methylomonas sp. SURF-2]|uniref:Transposase n=1 Tax=Methylomonas subterranea TaxID=2952225 RepID=A0ABT1TEM7_9GAMM|nr:transposase [Methylomonas sp. SURF-2]MCQ8103919.1 transposase [Methylomonas sp. SURF-2]
MSRYRRLQNPGATYFFTVVTYRRQAILCDEPIREALRTAIAITRIKRPFTIDAWVLLPDHLHAIWTLPGDKADYSTRWSVIKRQVSVACGDTYRRGEWINASKRKHRESTLWQRRYWEHQIRDEVDFDRHMDCILFRPEHRNFWRIGPDRGAAWMPLVFAGPGTVLRKPSSKATNLPGANSNSR